MRIRYICLILYFVSNFAYSAVNKDYLIDIIKYGDEWQFWQLQKDLPDIMSIFSLNHEDLCSAIVQRINGHNQEYVFFPQFFITLFLGYSPYFLVGVIESVCENLNRLWGDDFELFINSLEILIDRAVNTKTFNKLHETEYSGFEFQEEMLEELLVCVNRMYGLIYYISIPSGDDVCLQVKMNYLKKLNNLLWHLGHHGFYGEYTPNAVKKYRGACPMCVAQKI